MEVQIVYQSKKRKQYKLIHIYFERISFNSKGVYDVSVALLSPEMRIDFEYMNRRMFRHVRLLGEKLEALPIPRAPVIPSREEINIIKLHMEKNIRHY
ncbi:hypothetical protein J14TS5_50600 [Paenibacillus lautus]|nr:hypothetical protein J14TS5_50600 [Paenibacillus lautus]